MPAATNPAPKAAAPAATQTYDLPRSLAALLRPREDLTVSQWVERYRRLHEKDAAESGDFRFDRIPYMVEPTDAFADPSVRSIVLIKASRCSGTELLNNVLAYSVDARPGPMMYVLPRATDVDEEFKGRLRRIIEGSPKLAAHVPGGNWATEDAITLDTMTVVAAAATSAGDFIRRTSMINLFDEVDNCAAAAGRLGDVWTLLLDRLTTFGYRGKQLGVSTPTTVEGAGWKAYEKSDRRRYWCPCPRCGHYQHLRFEQIKLAPGFEDERDPQKVEFRHLGRYQCEHPGCAEFLPEAEKLWMTCRGLWVPACRRIVGRLDLGSRELPDRAHFRVPDRWTPPVEGEQPMGFDRGYWVDAAVSPWRTFGAFLAKFFETKDDPGQYRVFWNGWRAMPWQDATVSADPGDLMKKVDVGHPPDRVPAKAVILIGYADVQAHWLYYNLWAFGPNEESWLVRHGTAESFDEVEKFAFDTKYAYEDDEHDGLSCSFLGYDSGYRTSEVYDRQLLRPGEVIVTKGQAKLAEKWKPSSIEYYSNGRRNPHSVRLFHLNTSFFKEKLHTLFKRPDSTAGALHLHNETSQAYLDQLTSEHYVYRKAKRRGRGQWSWEPKSESRQNHYLDCAVGAFAIADMKNCRNLPTREVLKAVRSQQVQQAAGGNRPGGGVRMPDGRSFLATRR